MLKRTIAPVFVTALLCLFALPATALAAENDRPYSLYVGNTDVAKTEYSDNAAYWTSSDGGTNWTSQLDEPTADSYIHYDGNGTLTLHNVNISRSNENGIYAEAMSGSAVSLTIKLEGTNTVSGWSGIFVHTVYGAASLSISGTGSLTAEGTGGGSFSGIQVQSNDGKAELTINNVDVTATNNVAQGIILRSGGSSTASLTVNGGELTASGSDAGIKYVFGSSGTGDGTPTVTVSDNAIVRANGGISDDSSTDIQIGADSNESNGGIVFDGKNGTVYGDVELQEDLEIGEGESLTLDGGASLDAGNHNVIVDGGTLDESLKASLGDSVTYVVRGVSLDRSALTLIEGGTAQLTATVEPIDATNKNVTWSSSAPDVATVDASGNVTAVAEGTATITAITDDGGKTAACTVTVEHAHDPAAAWSSDASGHWHACAGCSEKLDFAAHSGKVVGKRDGTCTEAGYTGDTVCSICGYVVAKGVTTPATGHSYQNGVCTACGAKEPAKDEDAIPATGDLAPMACALAGIFGMALVAAGLRNRTSW